MKKRIYRRISINQFQQRAVTAAVPAGRLVFAIDVAKVDMVAAFADERGQVATTVAWKNPDENARMLDVLATLQGGGHAVEAVMESSGTYGDILRNQLEGIGIPVFRVSGKRTHDAREVFDGVPSLHDAKSAAIIAKLHADGMSFRWEPMPDDKRRLKAAIAMMDLYQERYLQLVHRLEGWLARYWPEVPTIVELTSASLLAVLSRIGGPADVAAAPDKTRRLMRGMSHGLMDPAKIDAVVQSASSSCALPMLDLERQALMEISGEAHAALRAFKGAKGTLERMALESPPALAMAPTVGKATAAVFVSDVGDPARFPSAAAYVKAFGLNLKEKSSGKLQGHLKITKRGPGRARQYLWLAVGRWVRVDPIARAWYERKIIRDGGRRAKAIVALMRKLARALFHVGRGQPFDSALLFDTKRLAARM